MYFNFANTRIIGVQPPSRLLPLLAREDKSQVAPTFQKLNKSAVKKVVAKFSESGRGFGHQHSAVHANARKEINLAVWCAYC